MFRGGVLVDFNSSKPLSRRLARRMTLRRVLLVRHKLHNHKRSLKITRLDEFFSKLRGKPELLSKVYSLIDESKGISELWLRFLNSIFED